jgi:hypothetical protein
MIPSPQRLAILSLLAGTAAGTAPALAQETGACGQPLSLTQVIAEPLSEGFEPLRRFLEVRRSEPAYLQFSLAAGQDVTLRTESTDTDPTITLYDQTGRMRTWDDDSGGGLQALVAQTLPAGTYCAQLRPAGSAPVEFEVTVLVVESGLQVAPGTSVPCGDPATVRDLALGLATPVSPVAIDGVTDAVTGLGDFRITLAEPLGLRIDAASGELDTYLTVLDASGAVVAENDDFSGLDSRVEATLEPGEYCVSVRDLGGRSGPFTLALSEAAFTPPPMPCEDPTRTSALASGFGPGAAPVTQDGLVEPDILQSWHTLSVTEPVSARIDVSSEIFDTMVDLHDMSGGFIAGNDDGPDGGTDSRLEVALDPGDYCVTVRGFGDSIGLYEVTLAAVGDTAAPGLDPLPTGDLDPATAAEIEDMGVLETEVRSYTISSEPTLWTSFTVETGGAMTVQGMSVTSAFSITLFAEDGTPIDTEGPVDPMTAAEIVTELEPGLYYVALTNAEASGTILRQITVMRD